MNMKRFLFAVVLTLSMPVLSHAQAIRSHPGCRTTSLERNDDDASDSVNLGFTVNMFGKQRSAVFVNNNGNLTFDYGLSAYSPYPIPQIGNEMIAAFWADVDTRPTLSNLVTYGQAQIDGHRAFCANYVNVGYFAYRDEKLNSFQIVLIDRSETGAGNFDIEFNYERVLWETGGASGGIDGFGGRVARVGYTNGTGAPDSSFELPGSGVTRDFLDSSPNALVRRSLNTNVPGRLLFSVRNGALRSSITANPVALVFRAPGTTPVITAAQALNITSNGGQVQYNLVRVSTADGGNWLSATPMGTGLTPGTITVRADPARLARGAYTGTLFIQPADTSIPSLTVPVTFLVGDQVPFTIRNGVTNSASFITGVVVQGSIFSIFGENLAQTTQNAASVPLPTSMAGVSVTINGIPAPLFLVSPGQVNGIVPSGLAIGPATLLIRTAQATSPPIIIDVAAALPGVFTYPNSSQGIMQNRDYTLNTATNPARAGSTVVVYLTGIGAVDNPIPAGAAAPSSPLSQALARFTATIGGVPAVVQFAGYSPGSVGLAQVNVVIPAGLSGGQQLVLFAGDVPSAPVLMYVAP